MPGIDALETLAESWGLSEADTARVLGISPVTLRRYRRTGVPTTQTPAIAALSAATAILRQHVRGGQVPEVVRRPATDLGGRSLLDLALAGDYDDVLQSVERTFDLGRVAP